MSYRDPKQTINQTYTVLAQGLEKFYANIGSSIEAFAKKKKANEAAAQKALNKRLEKGMNPFMKEYNSTVKDATTFTGKMKDEGAHLEEQITWNLELIRNQLKQEIIALGPDATEDQIQDLSNKALSDVTSLHNSVTTFAEAREEYANSPIAPNEINAIVPSRNHDLITMMGDFVDDGKHNMFLHNKNLGDDPTNPSAYKLGSADWNVSSYKGTYDWKTGATSDDFAIDQSVNANTLSRDHKDKTFFNHVTEFNPKKEYSAIHSVINDAIKQNNPDLVTETQDRPPLRGGTIKDKARYVVNKEGLRNYLLNTTAGQNIMHTYTDDEDKYGHWQQMGEFDDVDPNTNIQTWSTHQGGSKPYSDEAFYNTLINNAIESYRYE